MFSALLKTIILSMSLEGGLIPGHNVSMYPLSLDESYESPMFYTSTTAYSGMSFSIDLAKYFYFSGNITTYQWAKKDEVNFYPFRLDFITGAGVKFKSISLGWTHGCYHPIAPNINIFPYGKIDSSYERVFAKIEIRKELFK
jgi:hypothetical protein